MSWKTLSRRLVLATLSLTLAGPAFSEGAEESFWPCIQRKVPELSLPQIWNGPELPASAERWSEDAEIPVLVTELAARRVPIEEAQQKIRDFASTLSDMERNERLLMLVQGLFDHLNAERSEVMAGIERFTRNQAELAKVLRKETSDVDVLRRKPDANPNEVTRRTEQLAFQTRVFQERAQSLTYVCEVPTLIEQRLYQLANTVSTLLAKPSDGG